ncbi:hypothetical protein HJFPF1_13361 [Paramyrothecium foliicola]|nr:hypothetical protein HJFPF1_13361 [Paramyrothecium foliicola]
MATPFMRKQAVQFDGALLQELQGNVSDTIAANALKDDLPTFSGSSVIHDNGCGYGAVTMAVMASKTPKGIRIHSAHINTILMAQLQSMLNKNPLWPVTVESMDACKLTFPDDTFSHSLATFVFAGLEDDKGATSHILRTLRPGGVGLIAVWKVMPCHIALENAHYRTRGNEEPMAPFLSRSWYKKEKLMQVTKAAGRKHIKFVEREAWLNLGTDLRR